MSDRNIEWVVFGKTAEGETFYGIQKAWFGHPAIDFFAKKHNVSFVIANAEKKIHYDRFLAEGYRKPLTH